ncbi:MAG: cytochrome C [Acidobacteria bacterium]|nr:cytochrome C [Acidobacteriota bacterium]
MSTLKVLLVVIALAGAGSLVVTGTVSGAPDGSQGPQRPDDARIAKGFAISPVPLDLRGRDFRLVGLGSYLVNAGGGCNDCHTNPSYTAGHDPFAGQPAQVNTENYLAGGVEFGPFKSRNITPDKTSGLPADMTFEEFLHTLRTGEDHDKEHPLISPLLQVMPGPVYGQLEESDLRAIYAYLSSIPHAEPKP